KDVLNAKEAGMQAHLAKPIDVHEFQALLLKYLGLKRDKDILIEKEDFPVKIAPEAKPCVLNIIDGLERVGSNEDLYKSILYDFKVKYKDIGAGFSRAYKEKNYKQGSVLAHDLKGVAGTIGASNLQHKALEFENAFRDEVPSAQLLYELIYTYQTLIEEIDEYIKA
ncbi:MAG: Hpt domain-containing protein, partial [Campylobacterota bacterium]|nr:Hpt domain-containing protein [Campylobacterota bacterium]